MKKAIIPQIPFQGLTQILLLAALVSILVWAKRDKPILSDKVFTKVSLKLIFGDALSDPRSCSAAHFATIEFEAGGKATIHFSDSSNYHAEFETAVAQRGYQKYDSARHFATPVPRVSHWTGFSVQVQTEQQQDLGMVYLVSASIQNHPAYDGTYSIAEDACLDYLVSGLFLSLSAESKRKLLDELRKFSEKYRSSEASCRILNYEGFKFSRQLLPEDSAANELSPEAF